MRIAVIGASGVLARNVVPRLVALGHTVNGLVNRPESAARAQALGARPFVGDIFDPDTLASALAGCEAVLNLATSVPRPGTANPDYSRNTRMRREGAAILVQACRRAGARHLIQQSIALYMVSQGDAFVDESVPLPAIPKNEPVIAMEAAVRESGLDFCILRGGGFYGPDTGYDAEWRRLAREGRLTCDGDGGNWVSLIHVADMGAAAVAALTRRAWGETLAIVDDAPVTQRTLFEHVAMIEGAAKPRSRAEPGPPSFRVSNAKARQVLGWAPFYPDFRVGLAAG